MGTMRGPAVRDFSASICPRVPKSAILLPYGHPLIIQTKKQGDPIEKAFGGKKLAPNGSRSKIVAPLFCP